MHRPHHIAFEFEDTRRIGNYAVVYHVEFKYLTIHSLREDGHHNLVSTFGPGWFPYNKQTAADLYQFLFDQAKQEADGVKFVRYVDQLTLKPLDV